MKITSEELKEYEEGVRLKLLGEIEKETYEIERKPILMTSDGDEMPCICKFGNGDVIELDKDEKHTSCGRKLAKQIPLKTHLEQLREFISAIINK